MRGFIDRCWVIAATNIVFPGDLGIPLIWVWFDCFQSSKNPGPILIGIGRIISDEEHHVTWLQVGFYAIQAQRCRARAEGTPAHTATFRR